MSRILCITNGLAGMLYSSLELARRLSAAGHEVTYMSFPVARKTVVDHAIPFEPLAPSRYDDFLVADATKSWFERLRTVRQRRQFATDAVAVGDLADRIRTVDPELLLIDCEMQEQIIAASATGVPIALLNSFVSIWKRPGLPPPHRLVRPGQGWKGSPLGISLLWRELRLRKARRALWQRVRHVGCDRLSILHRLAARSGLELRDEADFDQWLIPFIFRRLPVLSLHASEFEFPHDPAAEVHYVGPMVPSDRTDSRVSEEVLAELEAVFERRSRSGGRRKLIYAGFGSTFTSDLSLLQRLIAAVARREDWDLLISLGEKFTPADLAELPANVRVFSWLPQTQVLKQADVVVSHGGINTIDESVLSAVPLLLYCGFETDMGGNCARAAQHGIGLIGNRKRDSVEDIGAQIDRLLTEAGFKAQLDRLRTCYLAYAEDRVAERVVDSLLGKPRPGR